MTAPPPLTQPLASFTPASSTYAGHQPTTLVAVHGMLHACGVTLSNRKVIGIVQRFNRRGGSLYDYIVEQLKLTAAQQRAARECPDYRVVISYPDKTGEDAVAHVMAQRGQR